MTRFDADQLRRAFGPTSYQREFVIAPAERGTLAKALGPGWEDKIRIWASTKQVSRARINDKGRLYKPLVYPCEIRLLEIKPGTNDEKLQGSLHHCLIEFDSDESVTEGENLVPDTRRPALNYRPMYALSMGDLTTPVTYTALSYAWGPQIFEGSIECDGHKKAITKSLQTALWNFRRRDRPVVMWIDQICINQEDAEEKAQQIPLMGSIYQHAWNTAIWLGEANPGSDSAIQLLEDVNFSLQYIQRKVNPDEFEQFDLPTPESEKWQSLWDLLSQPWFMRLWIIQEVLLSRNAWAICGQSLISFDMLSGGCIQLSECGISGWLQEHFGGGEDTSGRGDICHVMWELWSMKTSHEQFIKRRNLFELLVNTRYALCYDSRDKIYSLLAICDIHDRMEIRTSYASDFTAAELYPGIAARHLADDPGGLRLTAVLSSVDHDSPDLPSWVPDWRRARKTISLGYSTSAQSIYNPNGRFLPKRGKVDCIISSENKNELQARGILVDTLIRVSDVITDPDLTYLNPTIDNKTLLKCFDFVSKLQTHLAPNTVFTAFRHVIVAGKDGSGKLKCPPSFSENISLLLDATTGRSPSLPGQTYSARQQRPKGKGRLELENLASRTAGMTFLEIRSAMKAALKNRRLGITEKGCLGLFPEHSKVGDGVHVLDGCHVPFLFRDANRPGRFRLVGECYVYGIMDGEAVQGGEVNMGEIILV